MPWVFICRAAALGIASVILASCAGPQLQLGDTSSADARGARGGSLLYLSNVRTNGVTIYAYPGEHTVGKLTGFGKPRAECADSRGDVWIVDTQALQVTQYANGGTKPAAALSISGNPGGCSVTSNGDDLAVAGAFQDGAVLTIFHRSARKRWRDQRTYADPSLRSGAFCGYDTQGNLFIDGLSGRRGGAFALAELPKGASTLANIAVSQSIVAPGQVQWDGEYLAVGNAGVSPSVVYRFSVTATVATLAGTVTLDGTKSVRQFWIDGDRIVGPDFNDDVGIWKYPQGGSPLETLAVPGYGAAVSR